MVKFQFDWNKSLGLQIYLINFDNIYIVFFKISIFYIIIMIDQNIILNYINDVVRDVSLITTILY